MLAAKFLWTLTAILTAAAGMCVIDDFVEGFVGPSYEMMTTIILYMKYFQLALVMCTVWFIWLLWTDQL